MVDILQVKLRYAAYAEAGGETTIDAADAAQIVELCEMCERYPLGAGMKGPSIDEWVEEITDGDRPPLRVDLSYSHQGAGDIRIDRPEPGYDEHDPERIILSVAAFERIAAIVATIRAGRDPLGAKEG